MGATFPAGVTGKECVLLVEMFENTLVKEKSPEPDVFSDFSPSDEGSPGMISIVLSPSLPS